MKSVIISGAASGIGKATAIRFLKEGYYVIALDIQKPAIENSQLQFIACDVSRVEAIDAAMTQVAQHLKSIDALVCCAGLHFASNILNSTEADYDQVLGINLKGSFFLAKAVLPLMINQKKGSIVFVGSDQTVIAHKNSAIYATSKAALSGLTKSIALDYASEGVRANVVAAGTVETPLYHKAIQNYCQRSGADINEIHKAEAAEQPLNRIGQPEEIASLIYFLCSDEAQFITGAVLPIDGGYTAK